MCVGESKRRRERPRWTVESIIYAAGFEARNGIERAAMSMFGIWRSDGRHRIIWPQ